jgi:murein L,D-transpeptidase YafK
MTDDKIKEIYLYAVYARNSGQKTIPVYMFPFEMTPKNMKKYRLIYGYFRPERVNFWRNLKTGYDQFMSDGKPLAVSVTQEGRYRFRP